MVYFPEKASVREVDSEGLRAWPTPQDFRGLVAEAVGPLRGTAIVFHGNAGHAGHRASYATALTRVGLRVIVAEYPGYGPRDGAVGEGNLVADAEQTIVLAHRRYGAPCCLSASHWGPASRLRPARANGTKRQRCCSLRPWDRLEHVAAHHYPWLPVKWLLRDRYDTVNHLASFDRPVLVAVAERDSIVPTRFGVALHEALADPKRLTVFKAVGHNDWAASVDDNWWREAIVFLLGGPADRVGIVADEFTPS